jgi:hypothetical protein
MDYTDAQVELAFDLLGVSRHEIMRARYNARALDVLQRRVKRVYRLAALELHPDRNGDDPEKARKEKMFKLVTEVADAIKHMRVEANPRQTKWALRLTAVEVA